MSGSWTPEILREAADYMANHTLIQGEYYLYEDGKNVPDGRRHKIQGCCARGAIHAVCENSAWDEGDAESAIAAAGRFLGEELDDFNDEPGRIKDDVVDVLRQAADYEEEETELGEESLANAEEDEEYDFA